jgi:hypothetical protein
MRKIIIAASMLALSVVAAEAKCTKKSLNGTWVLGAGSTAIPGTAAGGTFTFISGGTTLTMTLSSFSSTKCRGSGTGVSGATPFTFKMASERIPDTPDSPNHLFVTATAGATTIMFTLQRQ